VSSAAISNAQLETIIYAYQRFEQRLPDGARAGFFLVRARGARPAEARASALDVLERERWGLARWQACWWWRRRRPCVARAALTRAPALPLPLLAQGDGAGVGKGRQIAALVREFFATGGKRALWVSTR
jgi:hypothetical protein